MERKSAIILHLHVVSDFYFIRRLCDGVEGRLSYFLVSDTTH